jgi:hypothetical protein
MAAEANPSLLRQSAIVILARQAAMREVKRRRQKQGLKGSLPQSIVARLGIEWLYDHPELPAEAAASPIVQNLGIVRKRRTVGRKGKISVHNSGAEWRASDDRRLCEGQH